MSLVYALDLCLSRHLYTYGTVQPQRERERERESVCVCVCAFCIESREARDEETSRNLFPSLSSCSSLSLSVSSPLFSFRSSLSRPSPLLSSLSRPFSLDLTSFWSRVSSSMSNHASSHVETFGLCSHPGLFRPVPPVFTLSLVVVAMMLCREFTCQKLPPPGPYCTG